MENIYRIVWLINEPQSLILIFATHIIEDGESFSNITITVVSIHLQSSWSGYFTEFYNSIDDWLSQDE